MKSKILVFLVLSLFHYSVFAVERETFFDPASTTHGGFGGPVLRMGTISGDNLYGGGGKGAWLINHTFYLGGAAYGGYFESGDTKNVLAYSGMMLGFIGLPHKTIHYTLELLIADGDLIDIEDFDSDIANVGDSLIVLEPSAYLSINLSSFSTLNIGVAYRFVSGSETENLSNGDLSGVTGEINVMFGKF